MPLLADNPVMTPDEMLERDNDALCELIDGHWVKKNTEAMAQNVAGVLGALLGFFIVKNKLGRVFPEATYCCFDGKISRPDFSFIRFDRMSIAEVPSGHLSIPPDLAVEVISPNDLFYDVNQKVVDYLNGGVREIWLIDPECRTITIRRKGVPHDRARRNVRTQKRRVVSGVFGQSG